MRGTSLIIWKVLIFFKIFLLVYSREREREKKNASRGMGRDREFQADPTVSSGPDTRLDLTTHEIMT